MNKKLELFMGLVLILAVSVLAKNMGVLESMDQMRENKVIVLDAGHGGSDPGKIGINKALEKDVNLSIVLKLKEELEKKGYQVVLTRDTDEGLYKETDNNKKQADMKKRCEIIEESKCILAVSIHQNSFQTEDISGPQVFYFTTSIEGKKVATILQQKLIEWLKPKKERVEKANDTYYLLKKVSCPIVIVECGFLSNQTEAELLVTEEYQQKVAEAIGEGIEEYLKEKK